MTELYRRQDYDVLLTLWEASVRATHTFLSEADIVGLRPIVRKTLAAVELHVIRSSAGNITAFMGLSEAMVEMLFVHPAWRGCCCGRELMTFAIEEKGIRRVDVNEQNEQAFLFYTHLGFRVVGRDALDPQGNPFPILHLELAE